jgi:ABC-2 type transport system ATP-binding protein
MSLIQVKQLSKYYGEYAAIDDISFNIQEGEIVGLLGLNGAGKSTILKILGTFLQPSGGDATVNAASVSEQSNAVRKMIGYLPDTPPLYDEMRVVPYLRYVANLKDVPQSLIDQRIEAVLSATNLHEVAWVPLSELSHGFRQRVGIAQALVHEPKVLILDEPINGLDPVQIVEMRDLILSLRGKHTVILSSHILSEMTKTCDRIIIIDQGRMVAEGRQEDLERNFNRGMRLVIELEQVSGEAAKALQSVKGVRSATPSEQNPRQLIVELEHDVRAVIARTLFEKNFSILEMRREGDGLEGVFMKLVKASSDPKHH